MGLAVFGFEAQDLSHNKTNIAQPCRVWLILAFADREALGRNLFYCSHHFHQIQQMYFNMKSPLVL